MNLWYSYPILERLLNNIANIPKIITHNDKKIWNKLAFPLPKNSLQAKEIIYEVGMNLKRNVDDIYLNSIPSFMTSLTLNSVVNLMHVINMEKSVTEDYLLGTTITCDKIITIRDFSTYGFIILSKNEQNDYKVSMPLAIIAGLVSKNPETCKTLSQLFKFPSSSSDMEKYAYFEQTIALSLFYQIQKLHEFESVSLHELFYGKNHQNNDFIDLSNMKMNHWHHISVLVNQNISIISEKKQFIRKKIFTDQKIDSGYHLIKIHHNNTIEEYIAKEDLYQTVEGIDILKGQFSKYNGFNNIIISNIETFGIDIRLGLKTNENKNLLLAFLVKDLSKPNRSAFTEAIYYQKILHVLNEQSSDMKIYLVVVQTHYPKSNQFIEKLMTYMGDSWKQMIFLDKNVENIVSPFYRKGLFSTQEVQVEESKQE